MLSMVIRGMNRVPIMGKIKSRLAGGMWKGFTHSCAARQPRNTGPWGNTVGLGISSEIVIESFGSPE